MSPLEDRDHDGDDALEDGVKRHISFLNQAYPRFVKKDIESGDLDLTINSISVYILIMSGNEQEVMKTAKFNDLEKETAFDVNVDASVTNLKFDVNMKVIINEDDTIMVEDIENTQTEILPEHVRNGRLKNDLEELVGTSADMIADMVELVFLFLYENHEEE